MLKRKDIFKGKGPYSREVTGAMSDFMPWHGSVRVRLVKPRGLCLTSPVQARDEVIYMVEGVCLCVQQKEGQDRKMLK